jgi:hypothetical protein
MVKSATDEGLTPGQLRDLAEHEAALVRFGGKLPEGDRARVSPPVLARVRSLSQRWFEGPNGKFRQSYLEIDRT